MNFRPFARTLSLTALVGILLLPLTAQPAPPSGGGGGNKVTVTAANPQDAFQGEELDVIVSGSGFDTGSSVSYLVTGTTDASQVEVLSVQYISSTELKTRVRPKDAALPTDYDIQVQTSSGRKGKGTTLFRVKTAASASCGSEPQILVAETTCTGSESPVPQIVYLTEYHCADGVETSDIMLSSVSGCDQYLLLDNAGQRLPASFWEPAQNITEVRSLRLHVRDGRGIVIWIDPTLAPRPVTGLHFQLDENGTPVADPAGPEPLYLSPDPTMVISAADVRINEGGEVELVVLERLEDWSERQLALVNIDTGHHEVLSPPLCHLGSCFELASHPWWSTDGTEIYTWVAKTTASDDATVRFKYDGNTWRFEIVTVGGGDFIGISPAGLVGSSRYEWTTTKGGKVKPSSRTRVSRVFDPEVCVPDGCLWDEGAVLPVQPDGPWPRGWTADGGLLDRTADANGSLFLSKYSDPWTGDLAVFRLGPVELDLYDVSD